MLSPDYLGSRPIEDLFLYETDNQVLTIEDFIKINSNDEGYKLFCYFYGGYMSTEDFLKKYIDHRFRMNLVVR